MSLHLHAVDETAPPRHEIIPTAVRAVAPDLLVGRASYPGLPHMAVVLTVDHHPLRLTLWKTAAEARLIAHSLLRQADAWERENPPQQEEAEAA